MFKLGGKPEDLRNHLLGKAFGKHTKMIFGYCSPQVGTAGAARGPSGPSRKGREPGELKRAVISFSFITPEFSRLERKNGGYQRGEQRRVSFPSRSESDASLKQTPQAQIKGLATFLSTGTTGWGGGAPTGQEGEIRRFLVTRRRANGPENV